MGLGITERITGVKGFSDGWGGKWVVGAGRATHPYATPPILISRNHWCWEGYAPPNPASLMIEREMTWVINYWITNKIKHSNQSLEQNDRTHCKNRRCTYIPHQIVSCMDSERSPPSRNISVSRHGLLPCGCSVHIEWAQTAGGSFSVTVLTFTSLAYHWFHFPNLGSWNLASHWRHHSSFDIHEMTVLRLRYHVSFARTLMLLLRQSYLLSMISH